MTAHRPSAVRHLRHLSDFVRFVSSEIVKEEIILSRVLRHSPDIVSFPYDIRDAVKYIDTFISILCAFVDGSVDARGDDDCFVLE